MKTIESERAEKLYRGKLLLKLRDTLIHVKLDDEGDRVYLRSTNDAETLKAIIEEIDDYGWQEFMREKNEPDIFETCRETVKALEAANNTIAGLKAEILALTEQNSGPTADLTNHHNALKCPYCNPQGLSFAAPSPSAEPVAWRVKNDYGHWHATSDPAIAETWRKVEKLSVEPLYASPVSRGRKAWQEKQNARVATIEECATLADRAAGRCIREQIPGDSVARFVAQQIRALSPSFDKTGGGT